MDFRTRLDRRIHSDDILELCYHTQGTDNNRNKELLFALATDRDERIAYNALWVFSHFSLADNTWLYNKRQELINILLKETHSGKKRLLLTLLERQHAEQEALNTEYLDFCLSGICSTEPYGIRCLCMKQAFAQCRHIPELLTELAAVMEMLEQEDIPPSLQSTRKRILTLIKKESESKHMKGNM